jgi:hypothetical protein
MGENEIGPTSGPHKLASKERKVGVKERGNDLAAELEWLNEFSYGPKQV